MKEYICQNSERFSEKLDYGCYNTEIKIIVGFIIFVVCLSLSIYYISKIIDLLKNK